jgi:lipopolysaccharide/colanic/teichoic acid biosynthesis glycosyltransferase
MDVQECWTHWEAPEWSPAPLHWSYFAAKRTLDLAMSLFLIVFFAPLFALLAAFIKCADGGAVFFVQDRVGEDGRVFRFLKFRSMRPDAEKLRETFEEENLFQNDVKFKLPKDPRITPIGRIIRRTSLDELPQLWNVLVGDMSMVGPRPPIPPEVDQYSEFDKRRLRAKPGLTCLWQVSGRSCLSFEKQVELDVQYIESRSILLDLSLLLRTIPAVLFMKGAY